MSDRDLTFEYDLPMKVLYEWWTDLSGTGYVGKALKSLRPVGREGEKVVVETRWRILGMDKTLHEKLSLLSEDHWVWEPHMFGIDIVDDFALTETEDGRVRLTIRYELRPVGLIGRLANFLIGWYIRRMMTIEWYAADKAFLVETSAKSSSALLTDGGELTNASVDLSY